MPLIVRPETVPETSVNVSARFLISVASEMSVIVIDFPSAVVILKDDGVNTASPLPSLSSVAAGPERVSTTSALAHIYLSPKFGVMESPPNWPLYVNVAVSPLSV